ncbi:MAG: hypothetical protein IPK72_19315 [Candidatus Eisenbacteria bacterium]|nr:hypothetical protein [Candidatus Eisenbacteria bacterium]
MSEERKSGRTAWGWMAAYLFLRWILGTLPGYTFDVNAYKRWALFAARDGLTQVYRTSDFDYPPLYAYLLWPIGKLYGLLSPEALQSMSDTTLLTVLIKLPPLFFDLLLAWVLARFGRDLDLRGAKPLLLGTKRLAWGLVLPAFYLLNPAVLIDTAYWGQPDCIHSTFVVVAFLALAAGAPGVDSPAVLGRIRGAGAAWVALALATLMKPLGAPYLPLLLALTVAWYGLRGAMLGIAAAAVTTLVVLLPFLLNNPAKTLFDRLVGDVGAMPYTSVNGHNLWWALGGWRNAEEPWLGPLTATHVGLLLFGALLVALLWLGHRMHRTPQGAAGRVGTTAGQGLTLALVLGVGFFMLSTHMHENHLFIAIPLVLPLLPLAPRHQKPMLLLAFALTFGIALNLLLHDLTVPQQPPFTWGGPSGVESVHLKRPFFVTELWTIRLGTAWNLALFAALLVALFRRPGLLDAVGPDERHPS